MKKEFIPYKEALALKKLGFDESCLGYYENQDKNLIISYNNTPLTIEQQKRPGLYKIDNRNSVLPQWATAAPIYQQTFRWFRKEHKMDFHITKEYPSVYFAFLYDGIVYNSLGSGMTYEKAELVCLRELIKKVKIDKK